VQALALERPDLVKSHGLVDSGAPNGLIHRRTDILPSSSCAQTGPYLSKRESVVPTLKYDEMFKAIVDDAQKMLSLRGSAMRRRCRTRYHRPVRRYKGRFW